MMWGGGHECVGPAEKELFSQSKQGVEGPLPPLLKEDVRVVPNDDLLFFPPEEERQDQGGDRHWVRVMEQDRLEAPLLPETVENLRKRGEDRREQDRSAFLQIMDGGAAGVLDAGRAEL